MIASQHRKDLHEALDALPVAARQRALAALRAAHDEIKSALAIAPNWDATLRLQGAAAVVYEIIPTEERKA